VPMLSLSRTRTTGRTTRPKADGNRSFNRRHRYHPDLGHRTVWTVGFAAEKRDKRDRHPQGAGRLGGWTCRGLSTDFLRLVALALLISLPMARWAATKWLPIIPTTANLSVWLFAGTALLVIAIAVATVGFQALKAALANPVQSFARRIVSLDMDKRTFLKHAALAGASLPFTLSTLAERGSPIINHHPATTLAGKRRLLDRRSWRLSAEARLYHLENGYYQHPAHRDPRRLHWSCERSQLRGRLLHADRAIRPQKGDRGPARGTGRLRTRRTHHHPEIPRNPST